MAAPWQRPSAPAAHPAPANGGDQRRTLHLSLGGTAPENGGGQHAETRSETLDNPTDDRVPVIGFAEPRPPAHPPAPAELDLAPRKENGSFIDKELRARVDNDIAAFLAAFDAALVRDTQESRSALREATDRLLRAGARTRIELERLEARMPLPTPNNGARGEPAWRAR